MYRHLAVLTILFAFAAFGCAPPPGADSDVEGVRAWRDAMLAAENANDADATTALSTDDAVFMPPDGTFIAGADAIRAWWEDFFGQGSIAVTVSGDEIQADGDWGFIRGTWNVTVTPKEGGEPVQGSYYFIVIMHREADGAWKLARAIWHPVSPAEE